jgi:hypothetical protein
MMAIRERHRFDEWTQSIPVIEISELMLGEPGCDWCFILVTQRVNLRLIRLSDKV